MSTTSETGVTNPSYHLGIGDGYDLSTRGGERPKVRVLSLDGGGVRGIIEARMLHELEARTHEKTAKLFDVITGSSTGALVGLGVNVTKADGEPINSALDVVNLYYRHGERIFPPGGDTYGIWAPKYRPYRLEMVLEEKFGDLTLADTYTNFSIPVFETTEYRPRFFHKPPAGTYTPEQAPLVRDVLQAATAAPVYFPPKQMTLGDKTYNFLDGAVFAPNPSICGSLYTQTLRPDADIDVVCSLGTGSVEKSIDADQSQNWGVVGWGFRFLHMSLASQAAATDEYMEYLMPRTDHHQRYYRFQPILEPENGSLDDASPSNLIALEEAAETLLEERQDEFNELVEKITPN